MEDTALMGWTAHNKFYLTGSITSGLVLSIANSDTGSIPTGMSLSTYGDYNYDASTYEITAVYEGTFESSFSVSDITWVSTGDNGDIMYQTNESDDGLVYEGWADSSDAIATTNIQINKPYFKIRFVFTSPGWGDTDSIYISTIQQFYKYFTKGERIYANEVNENFKVVGAEDLMPRGGNTMVFTNGAYDIGSSGNKFSTIHVNNVNFTGEVKQTWVLVTSTVLGNTATSIDVSDLSGFTSDSYWMLDYNMSLNLYTTGSFKVFFNQDSTNSYYWQNSRANSPDVGYSQSGISFAERAATGEEHFIGFNGFLWCAVGSYRTILGSGRHTYATGTTSQQQICGQWLNTGTAISSINFRPNSGGSFNPGSKINVYRRNS